jgi:hypothetical protein
MAHYASVPVQFRIDVDQVEDLTKRAVEVAKFVVKLTPTPVDDKVVDHIAILSSDARTWAFVRMLAGLLEPEMHVRALAAQSDEDLKYAADAVGLTQAGFIQYLPLIIKIVRIVLQVLG